MGGCYFFYMIFFVALALPALKTLFGMAVSTNCSCLLYSRRQACSCAPPQIAFVNINLMCKLSQPGLPRTTQKLNLPD